jgi:hypothetical protein
MADFFLFFCVGAVPFLRADIIMRTAVPVRASIVGSGDYVSFFRQQLPEPIEVTRLLDAASAVALFYGEVLES